MARSRWIDIVNGIILNYGRLSKKVGRHGHVGKGKSRSGGRWAIPAEGDEEDEEEGEDDDDGDEEDGEEW